MLLKYFYNDKIAHASYMVGCQATGEAIVIDPGRDIEPYLLEAEANDMQIIAATETHIHADFVSGSRELAERVGAKLYLSDEGDKDWKYLFLEGYDHQLVYDGDTFKIGNIKFEVLHTPGHTPEHISFMITDTAGAADPMGIFTGDFVFVGDIGRPDLLEKAAGIADTANAGAAQMFNSVSRFKDMPDYLQVWPAHGAGSACGKALGAIPSSTVGYEKRFNAAMSFDKEETFTKALLDGQPEPPKYFAMMKKLNKVGPAVLGQIPNPPQMNAAELAGLLESGKTVIDTRSKEAFAEQHVPGTLNIPLDKAFTNWAGWLLNYDEDFYLIIDEAHVDEAMRDLIYIGLDNAAGFFNPDAVAEMMTESYTEADPTEVADKVQSGEMVLIDVRGESEWLEGHIPGAQHVMLGYLRERAAEVPADKTVVVQCRSGSRSAIGASILQAKGVQNVINLRGGLQGWAAAGLPINKN